MTRVGMSLVKVVLLLYVLHDHMTMAEIRNFKNSEKDDVMCDCEEGDIGIKYLCNAISPDEEGCLLLIANILGSSYQQENGTSFQRVRKHFSFNGAMSSIVSMLNGERARNRDEILRSKIKSMG